MSAESHCQVMQLVHKRRHISSAGLTWSSDLLSTVPSTRPRDNGSISKSASGVDAVAFQRQGQPGVRRTVPRRGGQQPLERINQIINFNFTQ